MSEPEIDALEGVAIVGMAGRFPGASDLEEFWRNLRAGLESISFFSDEELAALGVPPELLAHPNYVKARGVLAGESLFDASFFDFSPRQAELMDPQHRHFLECAWQALEAAGYDSERFPGPIGVFGGVTSSTYLLHNLYTNLRLLESVGGYQTALGTDRDYLTTLVSYKLNLRGPSFDVQTACSTSLVATALACQSLLAYQCDMALAGGVSVKVPQRSGYVYEQGGLDSSDGHCRTFSAAADGSVYGSGVGVVVLKRLEDALADGDTIHAVIRGAAINNDGSAKVGFTAPSVEGQAEVIATAHALAGVDPESIGYVECHGSGTSLGDPIEVAALTKAFRAHTAARGFCPIGAVKTNIGHLSAAAGVAGLIKTVLALEHREIPPSLHFDRPNPRIDFASSPFYVHDRLAEWPSDGTPRRAGVSAFGLGGTNVHLILEDAPEVAAGSPSRPWQLLVLSAKTPVALEAATDNLAAHLAARPDLDLADVAFTLEAGRRAFHHRRMLVCHGSEDARTALAEREPRRLLSSHGEPRSRSVAFLLSGLGDHYPGMARGLYEGEPIFRQNLDRCADLLAPRLGCDLREVIFAEDEPVAAGGGGIDLRRMLRPVAGGALQTLERLQQTVFAQPALFAVEYALAQLWMEWGVRPDALIGYSLGEYVAACLAGVLSLEDALLLVAERARMIQQLPPGTMLAVPLPEDEARRLLGADLSLAAVNGPHLSVVSGPVEAVIALRSRLEGEGIPCRQLPTTHAFHSRMMDPLAAPLAELAARVKFHPPEIPYLSNVSGDWITDAEATDPRYWVRHLCGTVRFSEGIAALWKNPARVLLEVGPGQGLSTLAIQHPSAGGSGDRVALPSLRSAYERQPDQAFLLGTLGKLWLAGVRVDWSGYRAGERRRRVPLPTYPFERRHYWVEPGNLGAEMAALAGVEPRREGGLYVPVWKRSAPRSVPHDAAAKGAWLIFAPEEGFGARLAEKLVEARPGICRVVVGAVEANEYGALLDQVPLRVVHLLDLAPGAGGEIARENLSALGRSLATRGGTPAVTVVSAGLQAVVGDEPLDPRRAALLGVRRALGYGSIDLLPPAAGSRQEERLLAQLLVELQGDMAGEEVAFRGGQRWARSFEALPQAVEAGSRLRREGVYLIMDGFSEPGLALAHWLADRARPRLVLLDRKDVAPEVREDALRSLVALDAEVWAAAADSAGFDDLRRVIAGAEERFGSLHGIFDAASLGAARRLEDLERALVGVELDFCVVLSALPAGEMMEVDKRVSLAAGAALADAFCSHASQVSLVPWTHLAVEVEADGSWALSREQAAGVLDRLFALEPVPQVVVSPCHLAASLAAGRVATRVEARPAGGAAHPRPDLRNPYVAPRNGVERALADIWQELVGIEPIGVFDSFFDVGGHSLLGTVLLSRLRDSFEVELRLAELFAEPTVAGLASAVEAAREVKAGVEVPPLVRVAREGEMPLSFAQQRLWLLDQLAPGNPFYILPGGVRLSGPLEVGALAAALREVVRRHETLRTGFGNEEGRPAQWIEPAIDLALPRIDLSSLSEPGPEVARLAAEQARRPFDLARAPLLRVAFLVLGREKHALLFAMHHIVSDGWSLGVLVGEVARLYSAFCQGEPSPLPELAVQYTDFAAWQRQWLKGAVLERQLSYWRQRLSGASVVELPTDRPRPPMQSFRGATLRVSWPGELSQSVSAFARERGVSLYMVLLAGFETLVSRWTGQEDVVVGSPIANRTRSELEPLIGFFVNTLLLRTDLGGDPSFTLLLDRVREGALSAYAHQDLPFEQLVEDLQPRRDLSRNPLFQLMLNLINTPVSHLESSGLVLAPLSAPGTTSLFDLQVYVTEGEPGVSTAWEFSTDLFDRSTVERLSRHFETLLGHATAHPAKRLSDLPLLSEAEGRQLLVDWNATARPLPTGHVHERIAAGASVRPESVAVVCGGEWLSSAELDRRSNRLAHWLRRLGVGPEGMVGVALERSLEMVVALLAVLKAGGSYLPLDPSYPAERLCLMLEDSGAPVLLTEKALVERFPSYGGEVVILSRGAAVPGRQVAAAPRSGVGPKNLAYVIYTSGSTGRPKGVQIPHGALSNFLSSMEEQPGLSTGGVLVAVTSLSFDIAGLELYLPLLSGARLVLASREEAADGALLRDLLSRSEATAMQATPATWRLLLEAGWSGGEWLSVLCGGEALEPSLAERLRARSGSLWNLYGPTETTVWSTLAELTSAGPVAIGRPIGNTDVYLLDRRGVPVPERASGELYLGGAGVARGYLGRPDLTAERFVPNPFGEAGSRLYRTGDLTRYRPDGVLDCLGRLDDQVKVRGYRIELGEIEAVLGTHPAVGTAVVLALEVSPGDRRLTAYIVGRPSEEEWAGELRAWLRRSLPEYMVPTGWVELEALPLTPNGKVDRRALSAIAPEARSREGAVAPRTRVEEKLAGIWAEVLGLDGPIGVETSFFDLGGHSLLATQVLARLPQAFGVELPLRRIFERPTVAGLAATIAAAQGDEAGVEIPPLVRVAREGEMPLSFAQQRLWLLDQLAPGNPFYILPGGVRLSGPLDLGALEAALHEVVRRHETLRTGFGNEEGRPVQWIEPAIELDLPRIDLSSLSEPGLEMARLAAKQARRPFDLARAPLLRVALLVLAREEHALLFAMHHIVSDGWSLGVLVGEVARLYSAFRHGEPSPLPELVVQYADFAAWQRQWLQGGVLERQLSYWRQRLSGAPVVELPRDRPRPPMQSFRGATLRLSWRRELSESVSALARERGVSLYMVLLAGFETLVSRWTGQEDVVVGSPIANRTRSELEPLIGFFVNTLLLRMDLGGDPSFALLLDRVREGALSAYAHQDLPFEQLVEELQPRRDLSRNPLFQLMLNLINTPVSHLESSGLVLTPLSVPGTTSLFDLQVYVTEGEQGLSTAWEFSTDLFDRSTVERLSRHFETLLGHAAAHPESRLSDLALLSESESRQLLVDWNATARPLPLRHVHERIAAGASARPESVAVVCGGEWLSSAELDRRSNRLAHWLGRLGVGPETRVGVALERSLEMVVALLAVLKAGGAYLPLDPSYPLERLALMLEDSGAPVLLTEKPLVERFPSYGGEMVILSRGAAVPGRQVAAAPRSGVGPENLAYVIYTSGSTGRPKGVQISHGALSNFLSSMEVQPGLSAEGALVAVTSLSFDIAGLELYLPLLSGARLVVASREEATDGALLRELLSRSEATAVQATPATWRLLLEAGWSGGESLSVLCGGEALEPSLAERLRARSGSLWNLYGPTETTVWSTLAELASAGPVAIGRPIGNTEVYLLDRRGVPVPERAPGELYLGGAGVARGYLGRPDLTAERFVPNPFGKAGSRLYRTGDLARYRRDGVLDCLGRLDDQVKVRGYRIELGEIEAVLGAHPEVGAAVVLAPEVSSDDRRLTAYVVGRLSGEDRSGELRAWLRRSLPEYMVPTGWVELEALPLTPNGKLDRRALSAMAPEARGREGVVAPRTWVEQKLAGIWVEVLGLDGPIGVEQSFFDLGGHSLLATRVLVRLPQAFGVELPLRRIFERPSVAGLAAAIEAAWGQVEKAPQAPSLLATAREGRFPLSFGQQRLWFLDQLEPGSPAYNIPVAVRLSGDLDEGALLRALDELVRRHAVLRTTFEMVDQEPVQRVTVSLALEVPTVDLSGLPALEREAETGRLAGTEARRPFDLARGPLLRATLLRLGSAEQVGLFTLHHIVGDGWSMEVLVREVAALYGAFLDGGPSPLPEMAVQYADYALWQREWLQGEVLDEQLSYWRRILDGLSVLHLPTDRPRPAVQRFVGADEPFFIPVGESRDLLDLARGLGLTPYMALLAVFAGLLHRYSGDEDLVLGSTSAGRNRRELEPLIGFFVNTLAMRTDLSGRPSVGELLRRVRETVLGAFDHQDLPFEKLVAELQPERDLSRSPLFQVVFQLQNASTEVFELPGLVLTPVEASSQAAKFDLVLNLMPLESGLAGVWKYNTDLFDRTTLVRMAGHLRTLLAGGAAARAGASFGELPLLTAEEEQQLLEWNDAPDKSSDV
ncbi:MAG: hypothetical protein QOJ16_2231, partial [Acidobacteriota bacterium]|nr:hypothetical protein [Acidobacteriota bacterium]